MKKKIFFVFGIFVLLSFIQTLDALAVEKDQLGFEENSNEKRSFSRPIRPNLNLMASNQISAEPQSVQGDGQITPLDLNQPPVASLKPMIVTQVNSSSLQQLTSENIDDQEKTENIDSCILRGKLNKAEEDKKKWIRNFYIVMTMLACSVGATLYIRVRSRKNNTPVKTPVVEKNTKEENAAMFSHYMHDLGSNLNGLYLCAQHLDANYDSIEDEEIREFLGMMVKQSSDMADILANFKTWARENA